MSLLDENGLARVWSKMKTWVGNQLPGDFSGATTASAGIHGLVPAPTTTDTEKFLRGDGSWADGGTDVNVTQTESNTNEYYEVLLSGIASTATSTEGVNKSSMFTANPNTGTVTFGTRAAGSTVGAYSFAQGNGVVASGSYSHAEGNGTTARGESAHAEGNGTQASGNYAHAEGSYAYASGTGAHVEGCNTRAIELYAHAEGGYTTASGAYSHTEGRNTIASGNYAHAEGRYTRAYGNSVHAEGIYTTAIGDYSHAEGCNMIANHKSQHAFGEYNIADSSEAATSERGTYVEIVGNGTASTARSNARTLDWSGNEVLSGKLTVGTAPTTDMDVTTKKYVDDAVGELSSRLPSDDSWINISNNTYYSIYNGIVFVRINNLSITSRQTLDIGTLPTGYRPSIRIDVPIVGGGYREYSGVLYVGVDGGIHAYANTSASYWGMLTFPIVSAP